MDVGEYGIATEVACGIHLLCRFLSCIFFIAINVEFSPVSDGQGRSVNANNSFDLLLMTLAFNNNNKSFIQLNSNLITHNFIKM